MHRYDPCMGRSAVRSDGSISYQQYTTMIRKWDRNMLLRKAASASALNAGRVITPEGPSPLLPWNIAGMAITAICRGVLHGASPNDPEVTHLIRSFGNIVEPSEVGDEADGTSLIARIFHSQLPYQQPRQPEMARTQALFGDTPFPPHHSPAVMTAGWFDRLIGASTEDFFGTAFVLYAGAAFSNGRYSPDFWSDEVKDGLSELITPQAVEAIAERHFVTSVDDVKAMRIAASIPYARERDAFNPLVARPFLRGILDGTWIAPSLDLAALRAGTSGVVHEGRHNLGQRFSSDLGHLFEAYIGRHLSLLKGPLVTGEVDYLSGREHRQSCDWIVVFDSLVWLVEVKAYSPTEAMRQGGEDHFVQVGKKLGRAVWQLNETNHAIRTKREAFAQIPVDRRMLSTVVTLGEYPTAELSYSIARQQSSDLPIAFLGANDLELLLGREASQVERILNLAIDSAKDDRVIEYGDVRRQISRGHNPIVEAAWEANPVRRFMRDRVAERTAD
jgi:hypothetical protein